MAFDNIIMSKNPDEAKIKRMATKYAKFKAKMSQQGSESATSRVISALISRCETCWNRLVSTRIRDYRGEFQLFDHYWQQEMGKVCCNQLISRVSLEQNLLNQSVERPIVIALLYSPQSIQKVVNFINNQMVEQLKPEITICPINIQGRTYREQIQPKIVLFDQTIAVFWRGLFNEMILLSKYRLQEFGLFKRIKEDVVARIQYEKRIRDVSEGVSLNEANSQMMLN